MGHEQFKVESIELFQASDGTRFTGETEANRYESGLELNKQEELFIRAFEKSLKDLAPSFALKNPAYGILAGVLSRGSRGREVLESVIKDTPELTLSLLEQAEDRLCECYGKDGKTIIDYSPNCCRKVEAHLKTTGTYSFWMRQSPPEGELGDVWTGGVSMTREKTIDGTVVYTLKSFVGKEGGSLDGINLSNIRLTDDNRKLNAAILSIGSPEFGPFGNVFLESIKGDAQWNLFNTTGTKLNPDAKEGVNYDIQIRWSSRVMGEPAGR